MAPKVKPKEGIIGIFDILGYQEIASIGNYDEIANFILGTLNGLSKSVSNSISAMFDGEEDIKGILKKIRWMVFSDTVFAGLETSQNLSEANVEWLVYLMACQTMMLDMFKKGFPLRGAITYGKYYVSQSSFVGRPIMDVYKLSQNMEVAGCALTSAAVEYVSSTYSAVNPSGNEELFQELWTPHYNIPTKNGEIITRIVNWAYPSKKHSIGKADIRISVADSFIKHTYGVSSDSAKRKLENTELMIRYCKQVFEKYQAKQS